MKRIKLFVKWLLFFIVTTAFLLWICWPVEVYRKFENPSGTHQLVVYRIALPFLMPGQSGDAPGIVVLQSATGRKIKLKYVNMVQNVEYAEWTENSVYVKLLLQWDFR